MKKILIISFFLFTVVLIAEEIQKLRPYKLINADSLRMKSINENYVTFLYGNVHFFYGETEFFSNEAQIFEKRKVAKLYGDVKIFDDTLSVYSDETTYLRNKEKLIITGNALFKETHSDSTFRTFETEIFEYDRNKKLIIANQEVRSYDSRKSIHHKSGYLYYEIDNGYGYLMKQPIVYISGKDSLLIKSEKMEFFKDYDKIVASFDVTTQNIDLNIQSDFLVYFSKEERALFTGNPIFHSESANTRSKELTVYFKENDIEQAILRDSSRIDFGNNSEEKSNWIIADKMNILFVNKKIDICNAKGNVSSFVEESDKNKKKFINKVKGNKMIVKMQNDNKVKSIEIIENVEGTYFFEQK
ncbi:MAG: LptA/OstA family protein [Candidatus Cloacimonadota bacterium]|nr:LptA/OstA family protein [Candidatus Cloacimonadota bacterium]